MYYVSFGFFFFLIVFKGGYDDDVVVQIYFRQQDDEVDQLEDLEVLLSQEERDQLDEQGFYIIQYYACRRIQFFSYINFSKVEESYINNVFWKRIVKKNIRKGIKVYGFLK